MSEIQFLIEKGGERKYVPQAELFASVKDGWQVIGRRKPPEGKPARPAKAPAPSKAAAKAAETK